MTNNKFHLRRGIQVSRGQCLAYSKACSCNTRLSGMDEGSLTLLEKGVSLFSSHSSRGQPGPEPQFAHPRGCAGVSGSLHLWSGAARLKPQFSGCPARTMPRHSRRGQARSGDGASAYHTADSAQAALQARRAARERRDGVGVGVGVSFL